MSLRKNVIANYLGQAWRALMALAFIPLYIDYLGIEAYGLIGVFAVLQASLALLDMGMKPVLGREMARFTAGAHNAQSIRDLLRSIESIGLAIAGAVALGIWAASGWLASDWLAAENLAVEVVAQALAIMGAVIGLRFLEGIYVSSVVGLQRQVIQNIVTSAMATVRGLGAVGVLAWVSPTISAFFVWQGLVSMITAALFAGTVYRALPHGGRPARFSWVALKGIWRFAAGMMTITLLTILLIQVDKILLSGLLPLKTYGYYVLAGVVAHALYRLTGPVTTALYPRFVEMVTHDDEDALRALYHHGAQLVTVLMGAAAIVLLAFGERWLVLWTADPVLAQQVAPLMAVLVLGTLINGLMWIPYRLQLAYGWTALSIKGNIVAVAILIPGILLIVPTYGAIGAAWVWVALNSGYLAFGIYFMHRRLLTSEKWRWYRQDVAIPLAAATATAALCRWIIPSELGRLAELTVLLLICALVLISAALAAPMIRHQFARYITGKFISPSSSINVSP